MRIPYETMKAEFVRVLKKLGFVEEKALLCAKLFTEASLDGVSSHGLNRFPLLVDYIQRGLVRIHNEPELVGRFGSIERWDGNLGPGNLNAHLCMNHALSLAKEHGMACVALRNTNHWMRGGSYGWQAADANCLAICFTNTLPNMPPWGGIDKKVGNNPLVIAVPRKDGHIVLDMAMSMFSYGKTDSYHKNKQRLPLAGGFDKEGNMTDIPDAIFESGRFLPMGYWKGSGLSIMLDLIAAILSDGDPTPRLEHSGDEYGLSQVFMTWSLDTLKNSAVADTLTREVIDYIHSAVPAKEGESIYYPGERTLKTRVENLEKGIPVIDSVWEKVCGM